MDLVDTHCHLFFEPLTQDLPQVLLRARRAGVRRVLVPAFDLASWDKVASLTNHEGIFAALGLHPWVAHEPLESGLLVEKLREVRAVAVGEVGLDFALPAPDRERQEKVLRLQLEVAVSLELPVILHCRRAFEELLAILGDYVPRLRGVLHAFSKGPALAERFVALGLFIALGGAITRQRAAKARQSAAALPMERLLLETDAPSIGLDGVAPEQTEPQHVARIAEELARLRGEPIESVARSTTRNAETLFRLP